MVNLILLSGATLASLPDAIGESMAKDWRLLVLMYLVPEVCSFLALHLLFSRLSSMVQSRIPTLLAAGNSSEGHLSRVVDRLCHSTDRYVFILVQRTLSGVSLPSVYVCLCVFDAVGNSSAGCWGQYMIIFVQCLNCPNNWMPVYNVQEI